MSRLLSLLKEIFVGRPVRDLASTAAAASLARGWAALKAGQSEEAERIANDVIASAPEDSSEAKAYSLRAQARSIRRDFDGALADYEMALEIAPGAVGCRVNQSAVLHTLGRFEEALVAAEAALALEPRHPVAHNNRGLMLRELGRLDQAEEALQRALQCDSRYYEARANLAMVLIEQGQLEAAEREIAAVAAACPEHVHMRWNRALLHLLRAEFTAGWRDYESRLERPEHYHRPYRFPRWDGQPLTAGSLLIVAEQGLGDEILFASCFNDAAERVGRCVIECDPRLEVLFARSFPRARIVASKNESKPDWAGEAADVVAQIPAGSLPRLFRTESGGFPAHRGYLRADSVHVNAWRARLAGLGRGPKVGISWTGGLIKTRRSTRSIPLLNWLPILRAVNAHYVSLQYVDSRPEMAELAAASGIVVHELLDQDQDYDETAALVSALDLVITVTTAVAHLAGAVGQTVWVLVPANPEWRYQARGSTMPWYPSARLFRQVRLGDWSPVVAEVAATLSGFQPLSGNRPA